MIELADGGGYITHLGAVAAARDLGHFERLERKRLRIVQYRGTDKLETLNEDVWNVGYAVGFNALIAHLQRLLPHSEVIREALRHTTTVYPEIALREVAANTLIHQDFTITGAGPLIEIYANRVEFTSPGMLLAGKNVDRLIGATPESRNERLAAAFRRYRICEERGTGFQKTVTAAELFGLPPIAFRETDNAFKVTLWAPRSFTAMSTAERIEACYQHAVLRYLASSAMTNTTLRERLRMGERRRNQVTNLIADAVNAGRIKRRDVRAGNKFNEYLPYWA